MGYLEKVMGDSENILYRTREHWTFLLRRLLGWLAAFLVFLGLGLVVIFFRLGEQGNQIRQYVGLAVLISVILPLIWIARALVKGERGRDLLKAIWRPILALIVIVAWSVLLITDPERWWLGFAAVAVALYLLEETVHIFLKWWNKRYIVTNRRVMDIEGIINKRVDDSALEKVNDIVMMQSFLGRIFGYGNVEIITGSDVGVNKFLRISGPVPFKRAMLNAKEQMGKALPTVAAQEGIASAPAPGAAEAVAAWAKSVASGDIPDLIKELDELRQKGIISEEEFQAKKKELLDRI